MDWPVLVFINALFMGLGVILTRAVARDKWYKKAAFATNAYQYLFLWLAGLLLLPALGAVRFHFLSEYLWYFVGGGAAFALVNITIYKALSYVDAAIGSIFGTLSALFTVLLAAIVLHQGLTGLQLLGSAVLMTAIIYCMVVLRGKRVHLTRYQVEAGFFYSVLSGIFFAIAIVNEQWLLRRMDAGSYVVFGWGFQVAAAFVLALLFQRRKLGHVLHGGKSTAVVASGLIRGIGGAAFVVAQIRSHNVALITIIANLKLIVVMVLGAWLLGERHMLRQKAAGIFASIGGLSIIFWR